jgi:DNA-binding transcriptional regulator PaaX
MDNANARKLKRVLEGLREQAKKQKKEYDRARQAKIRKEMHDKGFIELRIWVRPEHKQKIENIIRRIYNSNEQAGL